MACSIKHTSNLVRILVIASTNVVLTVVAALKLPPSTFPHKPLFRPRPVPSTIHFCVLFMAKVKNEIQAVKSVTAD